MMHSSPSKKAWPTGYEAVVTPGGIGVAERLGRGVLELTGRDRQTFLQGMVSNDVAALTPGQGCYTAFLDSTGHILADLYVHALPEKLLLETDVRCLERLAQTLEKYLIMEKVQIRDVAAEWTVLSVLGGGVPEMPVGEGITFVSARRHSLLPGLDLWASPATVPAVREHLLAAGAVPVSGEALETLRVEAGIPAWGTELDDTILLPEAEMPDAVSDTKGCYIGQEIVARISARGRTNRALRAILLAEDASVPHPGDTVHVPEDRPEAGREIGRITSAVASPRFGGRSLALAYVRREHFAPDTPVSVHLSQPGGAVFAASGEVRQRGR